VGRGSYIYGRSVHNIRIERLWVDVTRGFGAKWKELFRLLETHHTLNIDNERHLWLLHFLFLERINSDIEDWIGSWNHHTISSQTQAYRTPSVMYQQGMIQHGHRGLFPEPELDSNSNGDDSYAGYGVDWEGLESHQLNDHHREHNPPSSADESLTAFDADVPEEMSHIEVPEAHSHLSEGGSQALNQHLQQIPCFLNKDQASLIYIWNAACGFIRSLR
ncbi:hypothetical protein BT96DRAFT_1074818, partial [Gymnopus androsaceus JB14]